MSEREEWLTGIAELVPSPRNMGDIASSKAVWARWSGEVEAVNSRNRFLPSRWYFSVTSWRCRRRSSNICRRLSSSFFSSCCRLICWSLYRQRVAYQISKKYRCQWKSTFDASAFHAVVSLFYVPHRLFHKMILFSKFQFHSCVYFDSDLNMHRSLLMGHFSSPSTEWKKER